MDRLDQTRVITSRISEEMNTAKKENGFENEQVFINWLEMYKNRYGWFLQRTYSGFRKDNVRDSNKKQLIYIINCFNRRVRLKALGIIRNGQSIIIAHSQIRKNVTFPVLIRARIKSLPLKLVAKPTLELLKGLMTHELG